ISFQTEEEKEWLSLDITTDDVKANCEDLKVLGKGDFKSVLRWRLAVREELGLDVKTKHAEELTETVEITEEVDEEQVIQDELERINAENAAKRKRERRKANEVRQRTIQRMQLQMTAPIDIGLEQQDAALLSGKDDFFDLEGAERGMKKRGGITQLIGDHGAIMDESEEEEENILEEEEFLDSEEERERRAQGLEEELDGLYDAYQTRLRERDAKFKVKESRKKNMELEEWGGIKDNGDSNEESDDEEGGYDKIHQIDDDSSSEDEFDDDDEGHRPSKKRRSASKWVSRTIWGVTPEEWY
ncbi:hypothetical protein MPER_03798, partial [Moniliophthora perniciosa FA553]